MLRDRNKRLTLPPVKRRESKTCAWCGRSVSASMERYGRYAYCNSECHKLARKANATENAKRKTLAPVQRPDAPTPLNWKCWACGKGEPDVMFGRDASRPCGKANICTLCQSEKSHEYYEANKESHKRKAKARNRKHRASKYPAVPIGIDLSDRQLARCTSNLAAICEELPEVGKSALLAAIHEGRINGNVFEDHAGCGCLWGTIGRALGWSIIEEGRWAKRFRQRWCAEVDLFGRIAPGDTPATNPYASLCRDIITASLTKED